MSFLSWSDQHPVLFDLEGNPLIGRVKYLNYNTTSLKSIYQDTDNTIESTNPILTDAHGRTVNQVFLGIGDYTVVLQKYIGTNDMITDALDDASWQTVDTQEISGKQSNAAVAGINKITIGTIAELRVIDPNLYNTVEVIGYYSVDDRIASRTYVWSENNISNDNYGTIIQKTGLNTGRWLMSEPEEMDTRCFGIFPSLTSTYNSQLTALISWLTSQYSTCKSIRFGTGTYSFVAGTFTFLNKLILEPNVKFAIIGAGTLNININADFDIQTTNPLVVNVAALANVIIIFDGLKAATNKTVKSCWYGNWSDYTNGDSESLAAMSSRVTKAYTIQITNVYYATSGLAAFDQNIEFIDGSDFGSDGIYAKGGTVQFSNNSFTQNSQIIRKRFYKDALGAWSNFKFLNSTVQSSLFGTAGSFTTILLGIQTDSSESVFVVDSNITFAGSYIDNNAFRFVHKSGYIYTSTTESYAIFNSFDLPNQQVFYQKCWIGLKNQDSKMIYFLPTNASQDDEENAFYSTIRSAIQGNGIADMCGLKPTINAVANDTKFIASNSVDMLEIRNCHVTVTSPITLLNIYTFINQVRLKDFYMYDQTVTGCTLIAVTDGGQINDLILDNVSVSNAYETGEVIRVANGGTIVNVEVSNCFVLGGWLMNDINVTTAGIRSVNIHNNKKLQCSFRARNASPIINGNYIVGSPTGYFWETKCNDSALITGNRFFQTTLYLLDNGGGLDHVVTGNQFDSTPTISSNIVLDSTTAGASCKGLLIADNSFIGSRTDPTIMITTSGPFGGSHRFILSNNTSSGLENNILLPITKGSWQNAVIDVSHQEYRLYFKDNPQMFLIPGGTCNINSVFASGRLNTVGSPGSYSGSESLVDTDTAGYPYIKLSFENGPTTQVNLIYCNILIDIY